MNNFNLAYKAEVAMSKLITILLWTGVSEFLLFCGTFITFCAAPLREGIIWLQVVHLIRGVLGIILAVKLPRSHHVIEMLPLSQQDTQSISTLEEALAFNVSVNLLLFGKNNSKWLRTYSLATLVSYLLDSLCFSVQYKWFIDSNYDHTNVWMMVVSFAMLAFDTLYLIYLYSVTRALPPFVTSWLIESIVGDVSKVERVLH